MGRLSSGIKGLCPRSSLSLLVSFLSTFAILTLSFHLTLFAVRTFSGTSPSAIFSVLGSFFSWARFFPGGAVLDIRFLQRFSGVFVLLLQGLEFVTLFAEGL